MPEKPDVETLLPVLVQIAKDRLDIISSKEFRKILVDMGLALEKADKPEETKPELLNCTHILAKRVFITYA